MSELSDKEFEEYVKVLRKVEAAVHGESINHILNALSYTLGAVGADTGLDKKLVIANLVESVGHSFEIHKADIERGDIKWLN